jgi:uncharacterized membrane protein
MIDGWIHSFYRFVSDLGFPDPIHAALVHMPMGLVVGACVFAWLAVLLKRERLAVSAYHCIVLAFLFLFPVILFGIMDWRNFYGGSWLMPIKMKMIMAGTLFFFSLIAVIVGFKGKEGSKALLVFYTFCFITVVSLGWFGARLVYGERPHGEAKTYQAGEKVFAANCLICHADGGNKIMPDKPLRNSTKLKRFDTFLSQIRHPEAPMPPFSESQISDPEAKALYEYIANKWTPPGRKGGQL